jgi:Pyruvate/2-oxoacid:ferredoxin oxidoreductase gamma subunit
MERELVVTGIGGQGVQLAAQLLARAAVASGRQVSLFGEYGGMMRGGNTEATLVLSDGPIQGPPTVDSAWSIIVMNKRYWAAVEAKRRPDSLLVVDRTVVTESMDHDPALTLAVPAGEIAHSLGNVGVATMVALGAYVAATEMVDLDALIAELPKALPPYRAHHVEVNEKAIEAGAQLVPTPLRPAWAQPIAARG